MPHHQENCKASGHKSSCFHTDVKAFLNSSQTLQIFFINNPSLSLLIYGVWGSKQSKLEVGLTLEKVWGNYRYPGRLKHVLLSTFAQAVAGRSAYPRTLFCPSKGEFLFLAETLKISAHVFLEESFTSDCSSFLWDIISVVGNVLVVQEAGSHH